MGETDDGCVRPERFAGKGANVLAGPTFDVACGHCGRTFETYVGMGAYPRVTCSFCGGENELPFVDGAPEVGERPRENGKIIKRTYTK